MYVGTGARERERKEETDQEGDREEGLGTMVPHGSAGVTVDKDPAQSFGAVVRGVDLCRDVV